MEYYPGVFPDLAAYSKPRADLVAILLTGVPSGIIPGFQNFTGEKPADLLRLNMAIRPATAPNVLGILGGDLAGYPNGRRVFDDVFTIELRALAGVTIPLVDPSFTPDAAASKVTDGLAPKDIASPFLASFPIWEYPTRVSTTRVDGSDGSLCDQSQGRGRVLLPALLACSNGRLRVNSPRAGCCRRQHL